jgi:DNA topoisomerase-3
VFELPMAYVCERAVGPGKSCDFRSGRVILQQTVQPEQMSKLLAEGRTDLLRDFVSNRTRRKFAARLVRKPDGTTGFEFEPRPARTPKDRGASSGAATPPAEPAQKESAAKPARASKKPAKSTVAAARSRVVTQNATPKKTPAKRVRRKSAVKPDKKRVARRTA